MIAVEFLREESYKHGLDELESVLDNCELLESYPCCDECPDKKECLSLHNLRIDATFNEARRRKLKKYGIKDRILSVAPYLRTVGKSNRTPWLGISPQNLRIKSEYPLIDLEAIDERD